MTRTWERRYESVDVNGDTCEQLERITEQGNHGSNVTLARETFVRMLLELGYREVDRI